MYTSQGKIPSPKRHKVDFQMINDDKMSKLIVSNCSCRFSVDAVVVRYYYSFFFFTSFEFECNSVRSVQRLILFWVEFQCWRVDFGESIMCSQTQFLHSERVYRILAQISSHTFFFIVFVGGGASFVKIHCPKESFSAFSFFNIEGKTTAKKKHMIFAWSVRTFQLLPHNITFFLQLAFASLSSYFWIHLN